MSNESETDKAMKEMLNGGEPTEAAVDEKNDSAPEAGTEEETEKATPSDETTNEDDESAQTDSEVDTLRKESRKWESRAKANKEKADAHDALTLKVSELETELATTKAQAAEVTKWRVAAKYNVSEEDAELFLLGSDEETLIKQAERLSQTSTHAPKPDPAQGKRTGSVGTTTADAFAAAVSDVFN